MMTRPTKRPTGHSDRWLQFEKDYFISNDRLSNRIYHIDQHLNQKIVEENSNLWLLVRIYQDPNCLSDIERNMFELTFPEVINWIKFEATLTLDQQSRAATSFEAADANKLDMRHAYREIYLSLGEKQRANFANYFNEIATWFEFEIKAGLTPNQKIALSQYFKPVDNGETTIEKAIVAIYSAPDVKLNQDQQRQLKQTYPTYPFPEINETATTSVTRSGRKQSTVKRLGLGFHTDESKKSPSTLSIKSEDSSVAGMSKSSSTVNILSSLTPLPETAVIVAPPTSAEERKKRIADLRSEIAALESDIAECQAKRARTETHQSTATTNATTNNQGRPYVIS